MRKNKSFNAKLASTRNELIDLLDQKTVVIEINQYLMSEFDKEYKQSKKITKGSKVIRNLTALATISGIINPATTIPTILLMGGVSVLAGGVALSDEFKDYSTISFDYNSTSHIILLRRADFDDKLDCISEYSYITFSKYNTCPHCNKRLKPDPQNKGVSLCEKCRRKVVVYH